MTYNFPVTHPFDARDVTESEFSIQGGLPDQLYVNLDEFRRSEYLDDIKYNLHIIGSRLERETQNYIKIVFSGHQGCGKSTELNKLHRDLHSPRSYYSIFIEVEKETEVGLFQPEDLFILMISKTVEHLVNLGIESQELDDILRDWISDEELKKELKTEYGLDFNSSLQGGVSAFFLKLKSNLKALFSFKSVTSRVIREKVRKNPIDLINRFNIVLSDVRSAVRKQKQGKDLLFIFDGSEKIPYEAYKQIFLKDPHLIKAIQSNALFSVPIYSYFDIKGTPRASFFQICMLPMVRLDENSRSRFSEIVTRRIDSSSFFGDGVLDYCVSSSGGCPRQLLRIVNRAILKSRGKRIEIEMAERACSELAQSMIELLDSEHYEILRKKAFDRSDPKVLELLFSLVVLKYNGHREINPLISNRLKLA
jgi:hypothetical protein